MGFFGASEFAGMLADLGVPISWGSVQGYGIVDVVDHELIDEASIQITGKERQVTLESTRFAGLKERETLTVEGVAHLVLQTRQVGDGCAMEVLCIPS